jgi:hypothetical protein
MTDNYRCNDSIRGTLASRKAFGHLGIAWLRVWRGPTYSLATERSFELPNQSRIDTAGVQEVKLAFTQFAKLEDCSNLAHEGLDDGSS